MKPSERGRFCNACQKTVVDFTGKSEEEIIMAIATATGSVCGRIQSSVLQSGLYAQKGKAILIWFSILLTFLALLLHTAIAKAREFNSNYGPNVNGSTTKAITIYGKITDKETSAELGLVHIEVFFDGKLIKAMQADSNGKYMMRLDGLKNKDNLLVKVYYNVHESTTKILKVGGRNDYRLNISFIPFAPPHITGDITLTGSFFEVYSQIDPSSTTTFTREDIKRIP